MSFLRAGASLRTWQGTVPGFKHRLLRHLLDGVGFAAAVVCVLMATWALGTYLFLFPMVGPWTALRRTALFIALMMAHQLPTVPILAIAVNLAPRAGWRRHLFLMATVLFVWAFCTTFLYLAGKPTDNLVYLFMVTLMVSVIAFRSSARTATTTLMQSELDNAALDSEIKRGRLQLLRAQIEPHFLFNTLATVRALARIDRIAAAEMIGDLMRYLEEALPKLRQDESLLADELRLIEAYLRIHQIRMGQRLSFEVSVPDLLGAQRIPSMMLLTLVENALKHGINPIVEGGSICISARRQESALVVNVADSGGGLAATQGYGMGLANVRRRLTILYGDRAELTLAPARTRGVVATVSIPLALAS